MDEMMVMAMLIPLVVIIGGLVTAGLAMHHRARLKELAIRERIAMIERGITPPAEVSPATSDSDWDDVDRPPSMAPSTSKYQTAGVMLVGVGLGLGLLISLASGEMHVGVGVGGAVTLVGVAFLVPPAVGGICARWTRAPQSVFWAGAALAVAAGVAQNLVIGVRPRGEADSRWPIANGR